MAILVALPPHRDKAKITEPVRAAQPFAKPQR
jgi:predicted protein tyrosine phosphatase